VNGEIEVETPEEHASDEAPAEERPVTACVAGEHRVTVLELAGVTKEYRGNPPVRALDGVNLSVHAGEFVAIVGPSGSGKSTLINVVGALHRPTSGTVRIDGRDVSRLSDARLAAVRGRRIGFVFQQFHLVEGLTAVENVATALLYGGVGRSARNDRARRALERVGLGDKATRRPGALSGGERQRVGIARALVGEPAIILADEPTGNLDSKTGAAIVALFRELHSAGHTVVLITHDRDIAEQAPREVSLLDGAIVDDVNQRSPATQAATGRSFAGAHSLASATGWPVPPILLPQIGHQ
jgi:putative ABC transport system ATP-binding protein